MIQYNVYQLYFNNVFILNFDIARRHMLISPPSNLPGRSRKIVTNSGRRQHLIGQFPRARTLDEQSATQFQQLQSQGGALRNGNKRSLECFFHDLEQVL